MNNVVRAPVRARVTYGAREHLARSAEKDGPGILTLLALRSILKGTALSREREIYYREIRVTERRISSAKVAVVKGNVQGNTWWSLRPARGNVLTPLCSQLSPIHLEGSVLRDTRPFWPLLRRDDVGGNICETYRHFRRRWVIYSKTDQTFYKWVRRAQENNRHANTSKSNAAPFARVSAKFDRFHSRIIVHLRNAERRVNTKLSEAKMSSRTYRELRSAVQVSVLC